MKKVNSNHQSMPVDQQAYWGYTSQFMAGSQRFEKFEDASPQVTQDGVRFHVIVDETPFEFTITRQALEDLDGSRDSRPDLLAMFSRNRVRVETLALERIDGGARWPHLVIRMQDVQALTEA